MLLRDMFLSMLDAGRGVPGTPKLRLYSGHDTSVGPLLVRPCCVFFRYFVFWIEFLFALGALRSVYSSFFSEYDLRFFGLFAVSLVCVKEFFLTSCGVFKQRNRRHWVLPVRSTPLTPPMLY